jgi:hypothetical protein
MMEWPRTAYMEVDSSQDLNVTHLLLSFFFVLAVFALVHHAFRLYVACCRNGKYCGCGSSGKASEEV